MKRILFVDDETKILDGIRRMLHSDRKRWQMEFVVGGEAALHACESTNYDVVVSDMRMPGMDGVELLSHIRDCSPSSARIILSGYSEVALAARAVPVAHRFLNKPCQAAELQATIERVCMLQDLLSTAEIRHVVGGLGELPSLSTTYASLARAVNNPSSSISEVATILEHDIAMSAKVLQLVNSAFFGLARQVTSLQSAVTHLGMETIKNLVLFSETFRVFAPDARIPRRFCESMQDHAQDTAAISSRLPLDPKVREMALIAALLHDIGYLVLACKMPDMFCSTLSHAKEYGCAAFEAEEELLGASHAEIGAYLLGLWGMPNIAVEAIAHHHRPCRIRHTGFDCAAAVYVADLLAHELRTHPHDSTGAELKKSDREHLEALGVLSHYPEFRELGRQRTP
jgi:HD-like signal output (HDOD) protein